MLVEYNLVLGDAGINIKYNSHLFFYYLPLLPTELTFTIALTYSYKFN